MDPEAQNNQPHQYHTFRSYTSQSQVSRKLVASQSTQEEGK